MEKNVKSDNLITHDDFLSVSRRCHYNQYIAEFYERFADDERVPVRLVDGEIVFGKDENFLRRAKRVKGCCCSWSFDFYKQAGYKNLVRVDRCDDKFCLNCQSLKADQRFVQYSPILDEFTETNDMYHVVLTVPNVDEDALSDTVTLMLDRFSYLIRFFSGTKKIKGIDLAQYGYRGAVRSLEITVSKTDGSYHPHLHCIFVLKKDLNMDKVYWTRFSEDRFGKKEPRLFSEFELLLQRIWCLLILRIKVTKENIEDMENVCDHPDGFSCSADLSNGKYHEVFKYAIKGSFKNETLFKYENFLTLYRALYNRRTYQTYGCLSKYDFNEVDEYLGFRDPDETFDLFIGMLQEMEIPKRIEELLQEILVNTSKDTFKYVSRATFSRHFKALSAEDKEIFLDKLGAEIMKDRQLEVKI